PGGAAGPRSGAPHRVLPAPGRGGPDDASRVLLQGSPGRGRPLVRRAVPDADRLRGATHEERAACAEEVVTGQVTPLRLPMLGEEAGTTSLGYRHQRVRSRFSGSFFRRSRGRREVGRRCPSRPGDLETSRRRATFAEDRHVIAEEAAVELPE